MLTAIDGAETVTIEFVSIAGGVVADGEDSVLSSEIPNCTLVSWTE
jgi:hypothetical protein